MQSTYNNQYYKNDDEVKENLAIAYRVIAKLGLDDHTYTHLSARSVSDPNHFFIYPFGLRFEEVTKESLLKISLKGKILEGEEYQYNQTGYIIHGSIYEERKDLDTIFHIHTIATVAVSAMKQGLMPISQWALHFYNQVNYHEYNSLALDRENHQNKLIADLGDKKILLLRNHGLVTTGKTIHEAMFYCYHMEKACQTQIAALSTGSELIIPDEQTRIKTNHDLLNFEKDLGKRDWLAWCRYI